MKASNFQFEISRASALDHKINFINCTHSILIGTIAGYRESALTYDRKGPGLSLSFTDLYLG